MVEQTGHCPYLGLKQNQAIRFASPTPEHRCYAAGQAQEIPLVQPDYQSAYCLSPGHIKCPLYTGSGLPSTPVLATEHRLEPALATAGGLKGWLSGLPLRDRLIYLLLLALLGFILTAYAVAGVGLLRGDSLPFGGFGLGGPPPSTATAASPSPEPTRTPTDKPTAQPTAKPTATRSPSATPGTSPTPKVTATATVTATDPGLPTLEALTPTPEPPTATQRPIYIPPTFTPEPTNTPSDLQPYPSDTPGPTAEPSSTAPAPEPSSTAPALEPTATSAAEQRTPPPTFATPTTPPEASRTEIVP
jgi:hypothetical protein